MGSPLASDDKVPASITSMLLDQNFGARTVFIGVICRIDIKKK